MTSSVALSIRQPWARLIVHGGKDIENRSWPTRYRGPILVHAAKGMTTAEFEDGVDTAAITAPSALPLPPRRLNRGGGRVLPVPHRSHRVTVVQGRGVAGRRRCQPGGAGLRSPLPTLCPVELTYVTAMIGELALDCLLDPPSQSFSRVLVTSNSRIANLGGHLSKAWLSAYGKGESGVRTVDRPWLRAACVACGQARSEEAA